VRDVTRIATIGTVYRHSSKTTRAVATAFALIMFAGQSAADALTDHDNGPLTGLFGLPDSTEGGVLVGRGLTDWGSSLIVASHNVSDSRGAEQLRVDGETSRLAFTFGYGLTDNIDFGIEVPYLWHQSGSLDSLIDTWHDVFGFPGGSRRSREQDQLEFFYADSPSAPIRLTENTDGIGDIRLLAGWKLSKTENRSAALRFGIKLPTGDSDKFLGSGGADLSVGLAVDASALWGNQKLDGFYRANVTYLGTPELLETRYKELVGQLSFGLSYGIHRSVDLGLQSLVRSAVYDSTIESLGDTSMSLAFGATFRVSDHHHLVLSVREDVNPGTAPDVSFQIAFGYAAQ